MIVSKYVLLFEQDNMYFLFNSKNNSFLELNKDLYEELLSFKKGEDSFLLEDDAIVKSLVDLGVLTTDIDDQSFLDGIILKQNIWSYSRQIMNLTIAPTIQCNLRCPYCFEVSKPKSIISYEICNDIFEFIKRNSDNSFVNLTWFGGEPLLAIDRMEYILQRLELNNIKINFHSIITNATLLRGKVLDVFERFPLNHIQITFDGVKDNHDKLRVYPTGKGSFDVIMCNLDEFVVRCPSSFISIRVNVGKHNSHDYFEFKETIARRYPKAANIYVYPGILRGDNDCGYKTNFFSTKELSTFHTSLSRNDGNVFFPTSICKGCIATQSNSFVIGPKGELYKCLEDIGIREREIGSVVDDKFRNSSLFKRYMIHGTFVNDKRCLGCSILPICSGGCPRSRLENKFDGGKNTLCDHYILENRQSLKEMLFQYYLQQKNK